MNRFVGFALAALLAGVPVAAWAEEETTSLEELVSTMADTPEEHQAVAAYFRNKAEQARSQGELHKRMGRSYGGTKATGADQMKTHCEGIAKAQEAIAKEYEALALLHAQESKAAESKATQSKPTKP